MEKPCLYRLPSGGQCGKHSSGPRSNYCPHHEAVIAAKGVHMAGLGRRSGLARAARVEEMEFLKTSPLRAENPKFQDVG